MRYLGKEMRRVEGLAKVTGRAKYAAEFEMPNVAYGYFLLGSIAKGTITKMDVSAAGKSPGVLKVLSHLNVPDLLSVPDLGEKPGAEEFKAFRSPEIVFNGQPVALVVADTFEQARDAAHLIKVEYDAGKFSTDIRQHLDSSKAVNGGKPPADRGDFAAAFKDAPVRLDHDYNIPIQHHNPIEPHGATAFWKDGRLTIFDKSQNVYQVRDQLSKWFKVAPENVDVISLFVGGAFGSCLNVNYYPPLAALAARETQRPVRLVLTRRQMFTGHGYRPDTWQNVKLAASRDGRLLGISQRVVVNTSTFADYLEDFVPVARTVYACPNVQTVYHNVATDMPTPAAMRAPGAVSNMFALECAMDELSYQLKIDPLQLRLINYAEKDPETGKPFSSKALRECYRMGAEKFGWKNRTPEPRSMRDGRLLVGWGTATGVWPALQQQASVKIVLKVDGTALVTSSTTDIGPGTYTVMTMIAAEHLGIDVDKVKFELGDSRHPKAPSQGGSWTTASVGSAIHGAAQNLKGKLLKLTSFSTEKPEAVGMLSGKIFPLANPDLGESIAELMKANKLTELGESFESTPSPEREKYSCSAHGAQFVEVKVDPDLGTVKVTRVVEVTACGKIMNPKASHSQEIGGVIWGIGMALQEATEVDHRYGRMMNASLADYHVPVHADAHSIETIFVEEDDKIVNPLGVKGMGELGLVGIPAAIANAVYHATGIRVRDLPITPDKLISLKTV